MGTRNREKRLQSLEDFISKSGHATFKQLAARFDMSMNTARRDLDLLVERGSLEKVYGGVVAIPRFRSYLPYTERSASNRAEKIRIARAATGLIAPGDIVMMDSGSTITELAHHLDSALALTVISNSMSVIARCAGSPTIRLIALGGEFLASADGFVGAETLAMLSRLKADKAFISATGLLPVDNGIINAPSLETDIKRSMIEAAREVFLLIDSSKFGTVAVHSVAPFSDVDVIVTDSQPEARFLDVLTRNDVRLVVAEEPDDHGEH